jgi:hypothetical protein
VLQIKLGNAVVMSLQYNGIISKKKFQMIAAQPNSYDYNWWILWYLFEFFRKEETLMQES